MRSTKTAVYTAPAIGSRIVEFFNAIDAPPICTVENLDALASASIRYQESDTGDPTSWVDIPNTPATIDPGKANVQEVSTSRARIALHATGNVRILFTLDRQANGSPNNLGTA